MFVAPRYVDNNVVLYTSVNGGASFGAGQVIEGSYSSKTNPTDVFLLGSEFLIGGYNSGVGVSGFTTTARAWAVSASKTLDRAT